MKVYKEVSGDYDFDFWSGAEDTFNDIVKAGRVKTFWQYIKDVYSDCEYVSDTELNDFVWFERDFIYEACGLDKNGEIPEDERENWYYEDMED